ncbi:MAG: 50S ribosomal protein L6 [Dehalococcoidia bacterium]
MSRIGFSPIPVPSGVEIKIDGTNVVVKGQRGELSRKLPGEMTITLEDGVLNVTRPNDEPKHRSLHGLARSLLSNMVTGVSEGYRRNLDLVGTGYRAEQRGKSVVMQVGFSHPVVLEPIGSNELLVEGQGRVVVSGIDKETVGEQAARIRRLRKPNPYTGKGIKYDNEVVRRKAGKSGTGGG